MRLSYLAAGVLLISRLGFAQVDVTSELLLRPTLQPPEAEGLESGRYKVKKNAQGPASVGDMSIRLKKIKKLPGKKVSGSEVTLEKDLSHSTSVVVAPSNSTTTTTTTTTSVPLTSSPVKAATASAVSESAPVATKPETKIGQILFADPVPKKTEAEEPSDSPTAAAAEVVKPAVDPEPSVADQVRDLVLGNHSEAIEAYKEQIHPDDIRVNRIEVTVAPGVVSNQSKSSYSFRNYSTFSPKVSLGANFWLTPFMGLYGDYTTTMGSDVSSDAGTGSRVSAQHEWTEIGFDVRKFFGMSRKSNSLQFGLHMSEYKFTVPGDEMHRVNLRSSGVGVHLLTRVPVAPSYAWVFGGKLMPRVQHTEMATGLDLSSGEAGESTRVDFIIGGELKLARQNQIIWNLTTSFEKNQFNGQANVVDPERGTAPKGVSVENSFVLFSLGYRWGQ